ncbi:VanZ family protein [Streptomyces sp. NPDC015492]|uniref:VanZ family protein n=1 Tax=unclassified Streptomyces TaxID=2593676 RepID=UPI0033DDD7D5
MIGWTEVRRRVGGAGGGGKGVAVKPAGAGPGGGAEDGTAPVRAVPSVKEPAAPPKRKEAAAPVRRGPGRFVRVLVTLLALAAMVAFAVVLAGLTLEASPASVPLTHNNLTPGSSIENYLNQPGFVDTVKQLGGNIALGVPFGILLPLLSRRTRGFLRVAFVTATTMLLVELVQGALITGRAFDIDDVLLNTSGALIGYLLLGRRLGRAVRPRTQPRWWQRRRTAVPSD